MLCLKTLFYSNSGYSVEWTVCEDELERIWNEEVVA
jgi:hypothetical protein